MAGNGSRRMIRSHPNRAAMKRARRLGGLTPRPGRTCPLILPPTGFATATPGATLPHAHRPGLEQRSPWRSSLSRGRVRKTFCFGHAWTAGAARAPSAITAWLLIGSPKRSGWRVSRHRSARYAIACMVDATCVVGLRGQGRPHTGHNRIWTGRPRATMGGLQRLSGTPVRLSRRTTLQSHHCVELWATCPPIPVRGFCCVPVLLCLVLPRFFFAIWFH